MAWRSSLWVRWLGWTALYVLVLLGALIFAAQLDKFFFPSGSHSHPEYMEWLGTVLMFLVPAVLAFVIGVRFRSWAWGLGPLVVFGLPVAAIVLAFRLDVEGTGGTAATLGYLFLSIALLIFAAVCAPVALAGVWWGKRRPTLRGDGPSRAGPGT